MLKGERQDFEILDLGKAACAVELERGNVAGFCLNGQTDGPSGGSRLADGAHERPRYPAAPGTWHDVQIAELQEQPSRNDAGSATVVARPARSSPM